MPTTLPAQCQNATGKSDTWAGCLSQGQDALAAQNLALAEESFSQSPGFN
ncbi:MAG: hypothetical protein HC888_16965 [Candidatus Competibacteraceae bacterium]|nr:hypothetical protein [Candidatus Competibacteraceae bacterium]